MSKPKFSEILHAAARGVMAPYATFRAGDFQGSTGAITYPSSGESGEGKERARQMAYMLEELARLYEKHEESE